MNLQGIGLSEISQTEKNINYFTLKCQIHRNRIEWWSQGLVGGENEEMLVRKYKLPVGR